MKKINSSLYGLIASMGSLGEYNYCNYFTYPIKHRGKGHNKQAHKNSYKQKIKKNRRKR